MIACIFLINFLLPMACAFILTGLIEWTLSSERVFENVNESKLLSDAFVGFSTGVIGGLFFRFYTYHDEFCLSAVFLGTLYW